MTQTQNLLWHNTDYTDCNQTDRKLTIK